MASLSEKAYMKSPIWLQQLAVAVWGISWYHRRFNPAFHQYVREFEERNSWTADQFHRYQTERLARVFEVAWNAPYYRQVFANARIERDMNPWEALSRMPFLEKSVLRERPEDLCTRLPIPRNTRVFHSSGSTGTPTRNYYPPGFHEFQAAVSEVRNLHIAEANYRDRRVMVGGRKVCNFSQDRPPFWRISPIENMAYLSNYHLSPRFLPAYLCFFRSYKPRVVIGYASALEIIARYALENNDLPSPALCVVPVAETFSPEARRLVEAAWRCKAYDRYGSVEGCVFAGQCQFGNYHVSPEVGIIEILDENGRPCAAGISGEVICTGLQNEFQPLIRYRLGDIARWSMKTECACGMHTPLLEYIDGRAEDICLTPDGRQMLRFHAVFYKVPHVKEAQVIQEKLDMFVIKVVPSEGFDDSDAEILKANMRLHVGNLNIRIETVQFIERGAGGKFRAVICKLDTKERHEILAKKDEYAIGESLV